VTSENTFPIVGIGASAGGLEAIQGLLKTFPADTGMGFVVVTHLSPDYETSLPTILGRVTQMPVKFAEDGSRVEGNTVYVSPAHSMVTLNNGCFHLTPRVDKQQRRPIDVFLSSLAVECEERAVAVILSGSGNDGTLGVKAVKEHGGLTIAQGTDGSAPEYASMPDSAIASGVTDLVVPIEAMEKHIIEYAERLRGSYGADGGDNIAEEAAENYRPVYDILQKHIGHDFSGYKEKTFARRVKRRMQVLQIAQLADYVQHLRNNTDEVTHLFRDLLIGVTNFFRDPEAFDVLATTVIPKLFESRSAVNNNIRIWVPGCATGEEVYSLAILFREYLDKHRLSTRVQIFATDIDDAAIQVARAGRYPAGLLGSVSPSRLKNFFNGDEVSYVINKEIRDLCMFSSHSVIRDPPFSHIDLISCRNLLIYLGAKFQALVVPVFHFALKPHGYLFLGTSENVTQHTDLFTAVDKKYRIFQRRDHVRAPLALPYAGHLYRSGSSLGTTGPVGDGTEMTFNLRRSVEARVLDRYSPAHVVVNAEGDVLHYSAHTGKYLEAAAGMPNRQLISMARRGLKLDLQSALREAAEHRRLVIRENINIEIDDRLQRVSLTVEPFKSEQEEPLFLVVFTDLGELLEVKLETQVVREDGLNERLERDLRDTRERLQVTIEEYETAVEELKSSNEELQSINEELQSANEELETSKEELQSLNEELHTVNVELSSKIDELDRAHNDLRSLFESTQIATVFLDEQLVIRSFTPSVNKIFNLISTDRGRPLTDIVSQIDNNNLRDEIEQVFKSGRQFEKNVSNRNHDAHYLMRILPYRRDRSAVEGVLVTFTDITRLQEAEARQGLLVAELNHRVRNMLTVVLAIARSTASRAESKEAFASSLTGRIQAMSTTYTLVAREQWGEVDIKSIISDQLKPFRSEAKDCISIHGLSVLCKPSAAVPLGLIFHELATNASKYGALSALHGRVKIRWTVDGSTNLLLEWREEDGPLVEQPTRRGFGSDLIRRELDYNLSAKLDMQFHPDGLICKIEIPLESNGIVIQPEETHEA